MLGLHLRQQQFGDIGFGAALHFPGIVAGQGAVAPVEGALPCQDVACRAAGHDADIDRGVAGHGIDVGARAAGQLDLQLVQPVDEVAGEVDGADAEMRHGGVGLDAGEGGDDAAAGVLRIDDAHHGGLAHDHGLRAWHVADQFLDQRMRAETADLLVVAEGEMHRHLELRLLERRHVGEAGGDETLHVAGAATVEVAVGLLRQRPRIGLPGLSVDRHDVGMARQDDAALGLGTDRGEQVGLGAFRVGDQRAPDAVLVQVSLDVLDQVEIGVARGGVERHQALEHVDGAGIHGRSVARFRPRRQEPVKPREITGSFDTPEPAR